MCKGAVNRAGSDGTERGAGSNVGASVTGAASAEKRLSLRVTLAGPDEEQMKNIRQRPVDMKSLSLSPEEGFVLSRVDLSRSTSVKELVALTGFDEARVLGIVDRLQRAGAVDVESGREPSASSEPSKLEAELLAFLRGDDASVETPAPVETPDGLAVEPASSAGDSALENAEALDASPPDEEAAADEEEEAPGAERNERAYRQIYETVYHPMPKDARLKAAGEVTGSDLLALCLDADPQVIHAILTNPNAGLDHVRMIALHHRTQLGLEAVAKRQDHLKDPLVQRRLLRNPQLPGTILHRIMNSKLLMDVYKVAIDREIPERSRLMTRETLRKKFMVSSSDEKATLLLKTDGRCLLHLVQCSLDAHATQILCSKQNYSVMFVQNVARWSASPPALLAHLVKMPLVSRNAGLKKMLLKHPNTPSEAKRR